MKKINYKVRCEKRKVSKCDDICRTYSRIQSAMARIIAVRMGLNNEEKDMFEQLYLTMMRNRSKKKTKLQQFACRGAPRTL